MPEVRSSQKAIVSQFATLSKYFQSSATLECDRGLFDQNSLDQNCLFSVDRNFHNQLTEFFDTFQLIKKFDQLPKSVGSSLAVD
jgi:hypothetical protein